MINAGYFTDPSVDVFADAPRLFNEDRLGMAIMGTWYYTSVLTSAGVPKDKIGMFLLPSHNPDAGRNVIFETEPVFVAARSQNRELAEMLTAFPANSQANADFMPPVIVGFLLISMLQNAYYSFFGNVSDGTDDDSVRTCRSGVHRRCKSTTDIVARNRSDAPPDHDRRCDDGGTGHTLLLNED